MKPKENHADKIRVDLEEVHFKKGVCKECGRKGHIAHGWCEACWLFMEREVNQEQKRYLKNHFFLLDGIQIRHVTYGQRAALFSFCSCDESCFMDEFSEKMRNPDWGYERDVVPAGIELMPAQRSPNLKLWWQDAT